MIGKIVIGKSFGGCLRYVVQKQDAEILFADGIRTANTSQMTRDFNMQRKLKPSLGNAVGHISLNWSVQDADKLSNASMLEMAKEYLDKMQVKDTQLLIVRHNDRSHPHLHLIYNRVNNEGNVISDRFQHKKNITACKEVTIRHGLYVATGKTMVNRHSLKGRDKEKYRMFDTISEERRRSLNWKDFEKNLLKKDIFLKFKYAGKTDIVQGISFHKGEYTFKGSEIDRSLSFSKLNTLFEQNRLLYQNNAGIHQRQHTPEEQTENVGNQKHWHNEEYDLLDVLLNPAPYVQPEPEIPKRKKKKYSQNSGLKR